MATETLPGARESARAAPIPAELEAFFEMAERWGLSIDQQITLLGSPGRSTFFKWKKEGGALPKDTRERLSHLLAMWKALRILFTQDSRGEQWLNQPNDYLEGRTAIEVMLQGGMADIIHVRQYLDAQRGG